MEEIKLKASEIFTGINELMLQTNVYYYAITIGVLIILLLVITKILRKSNKRNKQNLDIQEAIFNCLKPNMDLKKFCETTLELYCPMIIADNYGFYLFDNKTETYVLKAVKYSRDELIEVGPSYSGLAPYKKESYVLPVSLSKDSNTKKIIISKDGKVPILTIPLENGIGLIRITPVRRIKSKRKADFEFMSKRVKIMLDMVANMEEMKNKIDSVLSTGNAMQGIMKTFNNDRGLLFTMLGIIIKQTMADSGFYIKKAGKTTKAESFINLNSDFTKEISNDEETRNALLEMSEKSEISFLGKANSDFFRLPHYFSLSGIEGMLFINFDHPNEKGSAVIIYQGQTSIEFLKEEKIKIIRYIVRKMNEIYDFHGDMHKLSASYQNTLKGMMQMVDNLSPNTIGNSELMASLAYGIATELGIEEEDKNDICLAAYLSNIGVLALSNDIFYKTGKYSDVEYLAMKLHSEVGAIIIESVIGNGRAAEYVRHHHERIDGLGYPAGLKGDEIPDGAKILAVAQFFLAKISGRGSREPMHFNKALEATNNASGSQLSFREANALIDLFEKKRKNSKSGRSLGPCWEMRCCPKEICKDCPAYGKETGVCWEYINSGIKCEEHGNECRTCFIRTEVIGRQ